MILNICNVFNNKSCKYKYIFNYIYIYSETRIYIKLQLYFISNLSYHEILNKYLSSKVLWLFVSYFSCVYKLLYLSHLFASLTALQFLIIDYL